MLSIPLPRVILERPFATFFVPMENNEENDNTIHSYRLSAHTVPSVIGIKELKVMGDVVFDLLLEIMCNFYYFETYKYSIHSHTQKLTAHNLTPCYYLR